MIFSYIVEHLLIQEDLGQQHLVIYSVRLSTQRTLNIPKIRIHSRGCHLTNPKLSKKRPRICMKSLDRFLRKVKEYEATCMRQYNALLHRKHLKKNCPTIIIFRSIIGTQGINQLQHIIMIPANKVPEQDRVSI